MAGMITAMGSTCLAEMSTFLARISQPVAQRLPVELRWGVSAANVGFSVPGWGDRVLPEARWRLCGDRFRRDPFMRQADLCTT